ncbi:MAG: hypothetical protein NTY47_02365 [Candidatus Omnitrophica bacterium]|nr:hypothetical protein [Candidatus Omnitrophota bacterium]
MRYRFLIFALVVAAALTVSSLCVAEDVQVPAASEQPAEQWLWGEVVSVKPGDRLITVKYIDPETDKEMNMSLAVDDMTKFENASTIDDIKSGNSVSFTYVAVPGGQNIAKGVTLEKIDDISVSSESPVDTVSAAGQQQDVPAVSTTDQPPVAQDQPVVTDAATANSVSSVK